QLPSFNVPLPEYHNATCRGFEIEGDSIEPKVRPGEWVLGKGVDDLNGVSEGKIYVVVIQDSVLVKKIHKCSSPSKIRLISINPEYPPIELPVAEIQEIWQVNSKLTFSLDANSGNPILKELQQSMHELKSRMKTIENSKVDAEKK